MSTKIWRFGFTSISQPNLGQITTSGTVLKTTCSQLSKTVSEVEIWPNISWEKCGRSHIFTLKMSFFCNYFWHPVSFSSLFSANIWPNFNFRDSFGKLRTCSFQNCPWYCNLDKIWWRKWSSNFLWTLGIWLFFSHIKSTAIISSRKTWTAS